MIRRCGKIAYHITYPQSIIQNSSEPIVQGTLLATYYEDLCNGCLDEHSSNQNKSSPGLATDYRTRIGRTETDTTIDRLNSTTTTISINSMTTKLTMEHTIDNQLNGTDPIRSSISDDLNKPELDKEFYLNKGELLKNSSSNFTDLFVVDDTNSTNSSRNSNYLFFSPWSVFKFFLSKSGSTFNLTYPNGNQFNANQLQPASSNQETVISSRMIATISSASAAAPNSPIVSDSMNNASIQSTSTDHTSIKPTDSTSDSDSVLRTAKCAALPEGLNINCSEFSADKMLAVRLCCLNGNNILSSGSGFSCRKFNKNECVTILPIIKCCLRDLSSILDDYFAKSKNDTVN